MFPSEKKKSRGMCSSMIHTHIPKITIIPRENPTLHKSSDRPPEKVVNRQKATVILRMARNCLQVATNFNI